MEIEKSSEFKQALKIVLKRQLNTLLSQFKEAGEEIAVMAASVEDRTCRHFGSPTGEEFMIERNNLANNFLDYCIKKNEDKEKDVVITLKRDEIAGLTADKLKEMMQSVLAGTYNVTASAKSPNKMNSITNKNNSSAVVSVRQTRSGRRIYTPDKINSCVTGKQKKSASDSPSKTSVMESLELAPTVNSEQPVFEGMDDEDHSEMEMFEENVDDDMADPDFKPSIDAAIFDGVDELRSDCGNASFKEEQWKDMLKKEEQRIRNRERYREKIRNFPMVPCHICGISLKGHRALTAHVRRVHEKVKNRYCRVCTKGFYSLTDLENHKLAVHTRQCPSCKLYVVEEAPWQDGTTVFTERKAFCGCGEIVIFVSKTGAPKTNFSGKRSCKPKTEQEKNYACGTCGKLFLSQKRCGLHARSHDKKAFICDLCEGSFKSEANLKTHLKRMHGITAIECKYCEESLSSEMSMKMHLSKYHAEESYRSTANIEESTETEDTLTVLVEPSNTVDL